MLGPRSTLQTVRAIVALAAALLAVILVGCGGSDQSTPTKTLLSTPSLAPAKAQATASEVATQAPALALEAAEPHESGPSVDLAQSRPTVVPTQRRANAATPTATKADRASSNATRTADTNLLLPDLRTLPPHSLRIRTERRTGRKLLRLGNTYWNGGAGMLELRGDHDLDKVTTRVTQQIETRQGSIKRVPIGTFEFHPKHNHWHFGSLAVYEVLQLKPDGSLGSVVATSGKLTYCLLDTNRVAPKLKGSPPREQYLKCGRRLQGLSVGWGDTYGYRLPDQHVDISKVPDDRYALRSTADPTDVIWEESESNNAGITYIRLKGNRVEDLSAP